MRIIAAALAGAAPGFLHAGYMSAGPPLIPEAFLESAGSSLAWLAGFFAAGLLLVSAAWWVRLYLRELCGMGAAAAKNPYAARKRRAMRGARRSIPGGIGMDVLEW